MHQPATQNMRSQSLCLPFVHPSGPRDLAVAQPSVAATRVSIGSSRLPEIKELRDPQSRQRVDFPPNTENPPELLSKITQSPLSQRNTPGQFREVKIGADFTSSLLIFKVKEGEIRELSPGHSCEGTLE